METIENGFGGRVRDGDLRPAEMTQNGTLDCEAICLLYFWLLPL